ncbi:MAG: DUF3829 domain-containing protein [Polyangiaceae bacterium]
MSGTIRQALRLSWLVAFGVLGVARSARAADKVDAQGAKIGVYIHMINAWVNQIGGSRSSYFDVVDKQAGLTCKESNIRALRVAPVGRPGEALSVKDLPKFRAALKKAPALDSDAAATQMVDAMAQFLAVDNSYFYDSKFLGDDCKRGKEIHAMLLATWPKFFQAEQDVRAAVEKYTDAQELVKLSDAEKKYGKGSFHWYDRKLLIDAKRLVKAVEAAGREPLGDPAPLHTAAAALQKTYDELHPLYEKFASRDDAGDTGEWAYMLAHAHDLARDAEARAHRMDDEVKKKSINPYAKGEISTLVKTYNDMIAAANDAPFSKTMK